MIAFAGWASLLMAASLLWLLRPLYRRACPRSETVGRGATGAMLAVLVPCAAIALYARLGRIDAVVPPPIDPARAAIEQMVARLAARLVAAPDDLRGWRTLARSYAQLHRDADAVATYRRLAQLQPDDADAVVDLAEALSSTEGGRFIGDPAEQVRRALAIDPDNTRALAIAANAAVERNDAAAAIDYWERLELRVEPGSEVARAVQANIEQARRAAELQTTTPTSTAAAQ